MYRNQEPENPDELEDEPGEGDEQEEGEEEPGELEPAAEPADLSRARAGVLSLGGNAPDTERDPDRAGSRRTVWRELEDAAVASLDVQRRTFFPGGGSTTHYLGRIRAPFPPDLRSYLSTTFGPGKYTVSQKGPKNQYLAARTFTVEEQPPSLNGNGKAAHAPPVSPAPAPVSQDWKVQAIATGGALLTALLTAIVTRPEPSRGALAELAQFAALLQVSNQDRADSFRQGLELAKTSLESSGGGGSSAEGGTLAGLGSLAELVTEVLRARRGEPASPAAPPRAISTARPLPAPVPVAAPAPAPVAQLEAPSSEGAPDRAKLLESALVYEINRALSCGDPPDTFVILLESWLDPTALDVLLAQEDADILAELPERFPGSAELLRREPVQTFLRGAVKMLREDHEEQGADGVPAPAGGPPATS